MADDEENTRRVKVYQLNEQGQWDDKGTGHVHYGTADDGDGEFVILTVQCEESGEIILEHRIEETIDYQRQGETIVTWCDDASSQDLALSFQETNHCTEVWEQIKEAQSKSTHDLLSNEEAHDTQDIDYSEGGALPDPELSSIKEICGRVNQVGPNTVARDLIANCLLGDGYLRKLFELFQAAEDLEQMEDVFVMFNLFKGIFLLNDLRVLEMILLDENIMTLIAVFEYDPALPKEQGYRRHRDFLSKAVFKEVVPINDEEVVAKIHQNYRITYIKDVILLRYLDDQTINTLTSMLFFNNVHIITRLTEKADFMKEFFAKLHREAGFTPKKGGESYVKRGQATSSDQEREATRRDLFLFLQELCMVSKQLQVQIKDDFYKKLIDYGLCRAIEDALAVAGLRTHGWLWLACADILTNLLNHDASLFRGYLISRLTVPNSLLGCLVTAVVSNDMSTGLSDQLVQILKMSLDPDSMQQNDKDVFLDHFYARQVGKLVSALTRKVKARNSGSGLCVMTVDSPQYQAVELLSFCVHQHGYRARQCLLNMSVMSKVVGLLKNNGQANVTCAVVRFIRTCIGLKEEQVVQRIVNKKVLEPIMEAFVANGARYNLLNSSVIELIEMVRIENVKPLVHYLVKSRFKSRFDEIDYVSTFQELKLRSEQNAEYVAGVGGGGGGGDDDESALQGNDSEYKYFNEDSDDENQKKDGNKEEGLTDEEEADFLRQTELYRMKRKSEDDTDMLGFVNKRANKGGKAAKAKPISMDLANGEFKKRRIS